MHATGRCSQVHKYKSELKECGLYLIRNFRVSSSLGEYCLVDAGNRIFFFLI